MAVKITGISDITKAMAQVADDMKQKVGRRMVASAAGIVKKQAKANVQSKGLVKTRALINNIVVKRETKPPAGYIEYVVGVRHGRYLTKKQKANSKLIIDRGNGRIKVKRQNDPFYWRFIEFGHYTTPPASGEGVSLFNTYMHKLRNGKFQKRTKTSNSQSLRNRRKLSRQFVPAKAFLQPALEKTQNQCIDQMRKVLDKELLKGRP